MKIPGVVLMTSDIYRDDRGYFLETHRTGKLGEAMKSNLQFVQGNVSSSMPWTMRGLHYQIRHPQGKLVRCLRGQIFDVSVDVRRGSPTFGKWIAQILDEEHGRALYSPPGFAHGFMSMGQPALVQYECTTEYVEAWNRVLSWNDPALNIGWPIPKGETPRLSQKDRAGCSLDNLELPELDAGFGDENFDVGALQKLRKTDGGYGS